MYDRIFGTNRRRAVFRKSERVEKELRATLCCLSSCVFSMRIGARVVGHGGMGFWNWDWGWVRTHVAALVFFVFYGEDLPNTLRWLF